MEPAFLEISKNRKIEIENPIKANEYKQKINGFETKKQLQLYLAEEPKEKERVVLGYIRSKDLVHLSKQNTFYFHSTDKQDNLIGFPYDLYNASKIVIYSGGRSKPFYLTSYFGEIKNINHKHKSKIKGKENSTTTYYFEIELKENFNQDFRIENNKEIKKWMLDYKKEYERTKIDYLPILTLSENIFE